MNVDDLILVSVDDHVVEPPDMYERHVPDAYKAQAPKLVTKDDGTEAWVWEGQEATNIGLNAVAGRAPEEYGVEPATFEEIRPGCYDIHERIKDMNVNGLLGSMCFPSHAQFCGQFFAKSEDKDLALVMLRAYNDWHIDEWCGTYPGRFIPLQLPPIWDPEEMGREVRRNAEKGCHAVTFSENPGKLGWPSMHDPHWDPFWKACADTETVICLHIGSSSEVVITAMDAPINVMITLQPMNIVQAAADLVWSRVLREFPVKFALSEGGIGWIPYFLERSDYVYEHHKAWTGSDFGPGRRPSDVFHERIITCFIDDAFGVENRHHLNIDHITWECDYPHSDSTWPFAPEAAMKYLADVPDDEINKITHENAMRLFSYDPYAHIQKEQCTVAALRAQAQDVDTTITPTGRAKKPEREVTILSLMEAMSAMRGGGGSGEGDDPGDG